MSNLKLDAHGVVYPGRKEAIKLIPAGQIEVARCWLTTFAKNRKTVNKNHTSYGWKHVAERRMNRYISNGAFLRAAQELGFKIKTEKNSLNAFVNISERSYG